jgi:hypothetical protein
MELSWAVSHVKVDHISSVLKMLQTQFEMVKKVISLKNNNVFFSTQMTAQEVYITFMQHEGVHNITLPF